MSRKNILIFIIILVVLSIVSYFVGQMLLGEDTDGRTAAQIAIDCAQCEYLPEGTQRDSCNSKYNCI